jgi:hypothetical protein
MNGNANTIKNKLKPMQVKELPPTTFSPFEISIKIENKREAELFWALSNLSYEELAKCANIGKGKMEKITNFSADEGDIRHFQDLWELIESKLSLSPLP